jgi:hypothetical protein
MTSLVWKNIFIVEDLYEIVMKKLRFYLIYLIANPTIFDFIFALDRTNVS